MFKTLKDKILAKVVPKKGFAGIIMSLVGIALAIGVSSLVMSYTAKINNDVYTDQTAGTVAAAAANNGTYGINNLAKNQGTIGTVAGAVIIISVLLAGFGGFLTGKRRM